MNLTHDEAQEALSAIQQVTIQTRKAIAHGSSPYHMILWGTIWFLGFLLTHIFPSEYQGWIWIALTTPGIILSAFLGIRAGRRVRTPGGTKIAYLWLAVLGYCSINFWIAQPTSYKQVSLLIVLFMMFGYVMMGIWVEKAATYIGLLVTGLALLGYFLSPSLFNLWMAILGGGTLVVSGVYILHKWK
jgi:hypothetical protein